MRASCRGFVLSLALAAIASGGAAMGQQAAPQKSSPQYYGYPSGQATASGQISYTCQPTPGCQAVKYGCNVTVCPCPCTGTHSLPGIPDIHPLPSCQDGITLIDELPPTTPPQTVTIHRNCYVPIKVVKRETHPGVTPVNIEVKWNEVHILCGPDGKPLPAAQAAAVLQQLNSQVAGAAPASQAPSADAGATPSAPVAPAPAPVAEATAEKTPEKQWVWLSGQNLYGFGYKRADGYWVIDQGSKRSALPEGQAAAAAPTSGEAVATAAK